MDLQKLLPSLGRDGLVNALMEGRWRVDRGPIERFPEFLQPDEGALSTIGRLENWPRFLVGFRDGAGHYHQVKGKGDSAAVYYDKGSLVNSRAIEEVSEAAKEWLAEWAATLGVPRASLRLNSWAVRGASGIDWHFDPEDVIHFQIKGDKLFKLLRTSNTCFADGQTKRFERIMADQQSFGEASEQLVEAGTITVIPRGVWHWSEGKSDESFAVSLCVNPLSCGQTLMEALSNRLRLMERSRMPLFGDTGSQRQALEACIKEAGALLEAMNSEDVLLQEYRRVLPVDNIDSFYFHLGKRANARLDPLRMLVDGQEIAMEKGEDQAAVLEAVCRIGDGFRSWELKELLPRVDPDLVNGVLASLVKIGFVDFIDGNLDPRL